MKLIHKLIIAFGVIVVVLAALIGTVVYSVGNMVQTTQRKPPCTEIGSVLPNLKTGTLLDKVAHAISARDL